jgi:hypothetical protein
MGGCAFLIWGQVDDKLLAPVEVKRTLLDRLLRRPAVRGPNIMELPNGSRLIDLPAAGLAGMKKDFRSFLNERVPQPWPSTKVILDYLDLDIFEIYLRGEQDQHGPAKWYVQCSFSGCAGTAEVSAELGAHWAEIWYRERRDSIGELHLQPSGFIPNESQTKPWASRTFLPVGNLGYALYSGQEQAASELFQPEYLFELDDAMGNMTGMSEGDGVQDPLFVLKSLEERFATLMADSACRCQLCMPDFDPPSLGDLP